MIVVSFCASNVFFEFIQRKGRFQYLSQIHAGDGFLKTLHAMAVGAGIDRVVDSCQIMGGGSFLIPD